MEEIAAPTEQELAAQREQRRVEQEAADARATRLLLRVGVLLLVLLAVWIGIVLVGFLG